MSDQVRAHGVFEARPETVGAARRFVTYQLSMWGLDEGVCLVGPDHREKACLGEAAALVVSELAANSVAATIGKPAVSAADKADRASATIEVQVRVAQDRLLAEVWDRCASLPICSEPDLEAEKGRGLFLVGCYTAGWTSYLSPSGIGKVTVAYWNLATPIAEQRPATVGTAAEDTSWLEEGTYSTPVQVAGRLGVCEDTVRAWARAGVFRYIADCHPVRYLLCDDDIDQLAELLHHITRPTLPLIRVLLAIRQPTPRQPGNLVPPPRPPGPRTRGGPPRSPRQPGPAALA